MRRLWPLAALLAVAAAAALNRPALQAWMFSLTGEETLPGQVRGMWNLAGDLIRPAPRLQPEAAIAHTGVNPFGINTFLQHEVEPAKRERQVQMIAEAGFHWLRQEFPWYDIEIHGQGDFEDRRFEPHRSAWEKYDNIVALSEQYGLEIIARLSAPPSWSRAEGDARGPFAPPDDFDDFADYAAAVAERYRGRVRYFQIWNEPNIYPEWGEQNVDPEAYADLLCRAYHRLKAVDPSIVVLSGALAPTSEMTGRDLNDFVYLQRLYDAGAGECFDILSMQGYGLFSGPTDHRRRPIVINYNRNVYIRDIMVRNGDAGNAIWLSEMNWNATPPQAEGAGNYGQVTLEQQARYAPLAYERAQADWPWIGVINFWYFKRADDSEKGQAWYYFRMAEPDFTPMPVYAAMRDYTARPPVMRPGRHQEDHWAVEYQGDWTRHEDTRAELGHFAQITGDGGLTFRFSGTSISLRAMVSTAPSRAVFQIDGGPGQILDMATSGPPGPASFRLADGLPEGEHTLVIRNQFTRTGFGSLAVDGFQVSRERGPAGAFLALILAVLALAWWAVRRPAVPDARGL
jgi:hypothetical protein